MKTLNIIGAGRVGRTLASLWEEKRTFTIQDVLDHTPQGAVSAVAFIGDGRAVNRLQDMRAADAWMLTPPDSAIAACCEQLAQSGLLTPGDVVFHCSGTLASAVLAPAVACGALAASVHPLKSFADPRDAVHSFAGTYCTADGERAALDLLRPAFERIGARVSEIDPRFKTIYHAASVIVCNYLTALLETGLRSYEKAGLTRDAALKMMEPLVRETVDNVFKLGTVKALTGPIARGDHAVVARQLEALSAWDAHAAEIYKTLGVVALQLARAQGEADVEALERLRVLLDAGS
ncbi:MAG: Rossmann-like and DUF2520 domain-containing protein [Pseudomonadota bacterium]|mgnify:CR=1 FL=1